MSLGRNLPVIRAEIFDSELRQNWSRMDSGSSVIFETQVMFELEL